MSFPNLHSTSQFVKLLGCAVSLPETCPNPSSRGQRPGFEFPRGMLQVHGQGCSWHWTSWVGALTVPLRDHGWSPPSPGLHIFFSQIHHSPGLPEELGCSLSRSSRQSQVPGVSGRDCPHQRTAARGSGQTASPGQRTDCQPRAGDGHTGVWASGNLLLEENEIFIKDMQGF